MSARCPKCSQPGVWAGSSGLVNEQPPRITDTYRCDAGHEWTITVTYE
jgi:hypothetical protein